MDALQAIHTRRSIRLFRPMPVEADDIRAIIEAGMFAATAGNQQPWRFVVVQDKDSLKAIAQSHPYAGVAEQISVAIVVCAATRDLPHADYWPLDCAAATQNLMLAAHTLGLGTVWLGIYPKQDRMELLRKLLHLPAGVEPFAVIPVGYPQEKPEQPERFHREWIRSDRWFEPWEPQED